MTLSPNGCFRRQQLGRCGRWRVKGRRRCTPRSGVLSAGCTVAELLPGMQRDPELRSAAGLFLWALRGEMRWTWRLRLWASGTVLLAWTPRVRMRSFSSSVDRVPEVRPRGDLRQDSQVRDGQLSVTGPPNPSRLGFLCAPPRSLLSSPSDVVRYFIHFLGRGNESGVRKQCHVVAAGHQPRPGDFEKNNQRRAAGDVRWPAHSAPIMGCPTCVVCPVAHILGGALGSSGFVRIPLDRGSRAYQLTE